MTTNIGFILGDWSRNIGNAYFQLGGYHVLRNILPTAKFSLLSEQPGYPSYWNPKGGNPSNFFDMASLAKIDFLVLMGPMFRSETNKIWSSSLEKILSSGTRLILLGIGAMNYDRKNIQEYRDFLRCFPPYIFSSRDNETYECLGDLSTHAYNGIDLAFFLPDLYSPVGFKENFYPFVALNFDKIPEPSISINSNEIEKFERIHQLDCTFELNRDKWVVKFPSFRTQIAHRSRYFMFLEGLLFPGRDARCLGSYQLVRTDHRPHPMMKRKTYRSPNMLVNDTPYPYLEIYSQAELTLSDRLHACVVALSYGKKAMLFSSSPRIRLLERIGLSGITKSPVSLDQVMIKQEKDNLVSFLTNCLS